MRMTPPTRAVIAARLLTILAPVPGVPAGMAAQAGDAPVHLLSSDGFIRDWLLQQHND